MIQTWFWIAFAVILVVMLAIDLGVVHRRAHAISLREAALWSGIWVALSLVFGLGVWIFLGPTKGLEFYTGYLIEKALSVDNIFVFVLIFSYFRVPAQFQHRVLFWGVLGALAMRGAFIWAGTLLLENFEWVLYVFGAFLVFTGIRMVRVRPEIHPSHNPILRLLQRALPITDAYHGARFFVPKPDGQPGRFSYCATPLLIVLVLVETTDLIFALDSIPAVFAITRDPFIVYTSNMLAVLGLRALYFLLAGVIERFSYLKYGLAAVLVLVGVKMLVEDLVHVPIGASLGAIGLILGISVAISLLREPLPPALPIGPRLITRKPDSPVVLASLEALSPPHIGTADTAFTDPEPREDGRYRRAPAAGANEPGTADERAGGSSS
ncbi:MAG TPA: TerC family protein [Longimicrobiales bacterium]|nr:TerC family protein [Longimicrobiales bacterium]